MVFRRGSKCKIEQSGTVCSAVSDLQGGAAGRRVAIVSAFQVYGSVNMFKTSFKYILIVFKYM